jgi:hypothetical protein
MPRARKTLARRADEEEAVKLSSLCLAAVLIAAQPAFAHHSFANFDLTKEITLMGTVKEVQFKNPHVWLQVMVPDGKGGQTEWSIEAGAPGMLIRTGWKPSTLKGGDQVTVVAHPARSGESNGSLIRVTIPDGRTLGPGGPPTPLKSGG